MSWKRHHSVVGRSNRSVTTRSNYSDPSIGSSNNYSSILPEVYAGHPERINRYSQYDQMDDDSQIYAALNTIADFSTQSDPTTSDLFQIKYNGDPTDVEVDILTNMIRQWTRLNKFKNRLWRIFRNVIKYGDEIMIRDPETLEWFHVPPEDVQAVIINEAKGKETEIYLIQNLDVNLQTMTAAQSNQYGSNIQSVGTTSLQNPLTPGNYVSAGRAGAYGNRSSNVTPVDATNVVHLSLSEGLDAGWPFGTSILESVYRDFKQKQLLEDAIMIYRIQRAPERRVFYVDVGNMPPHKAHAWVERMKNEIHQRRLPSRTGGGCFAMDVRVPLLDGRTLTIQELANEYESGKKNWIYSCDPITGEVVPGPVTWAGVTRKSAQVMKLTLDNGKEIICTPDHKFPIWGKGFVEAKDISENDSFISYETRYTPISKGSNEYQQIFNHKTKSWEFTHRFTAKFMKDLGLQEEMVYLEEFADSKKNTIHHKDFNRYNNNPENLVYMNYIDHIKYHSTVYSNLYATLTQEEKQSIKNKYKKTMSNKSQEELDEISRKKKEAIESRTQEEWDEIIFRRKKTIAGKSDLEEEKTRNKMSKNMKDRWDKKRKGIIEDNMTTFTNQSLVFSEKMWSIFIMLFEKGNYRKRDIVDILSNHVEFMTEYLTLNKPESDKINHFVLDRFTHDSLINLIKSRGFSTWKEFLTSIDKSQIQPVRKLKWVFRNIQILSDWNKIPGNDKINDAIEYLKSNSEFIALYTNLNSKIKGNASSTKFTGNTFRVMLEHFGYKHWKDFKEKNTVFNHRIVKIEYMDQCTDVGTITVDGSEEFHDFHTFALEAGVFTKNSNVTDAAFNPMSMIEDFWFPQTADGRGSKVTTLPGGEGLGNIDDLNYFNNQLAAGLGVPQSYLTNPGSSDQGATFNDGRLGTAYIQEFRFSEYCQRLQRLVEPVFDREFKLYLKQKGFENIDSSLFEIELNTPQHFSDYAKIEKQQAQINLFTQLADMKIFSKRWLMINYLGLTLDEITQNEEMWREENPEAIVNNGSDEAGGGMGGGSDMPGLDSMGIQGDDGMGDDSSTDTTSTTDSIDLSDTSDTGASPISGDESFSGSTDI